MYNIYCLQGYNNYYNRIVKKFNSIQEYQDFQQSAGKNLATFNGINFVPNDCVDTTQVLNWNNTWMPDYFITEDADTGEFSRWFVIECVRQRGMQYLFTLRRDLLVDFYDSTLNAPCFIEKANLKSSDPFIYNSEGMTFNQIKTQEIPLMDNTKCAWIVGYYDGTWKDKDDTQSAAHSNPGQLEASYIDELSYQASVNSSFANWEFHKYVSGLANRASEILYIQEWNNAPGYGGEWFRAYGTTKNWTEEIINTQDQITAENAVANLLGLTNDNYFHWSGTNISNINSAGTIISPPLTNTVIQDNYNSYGFGNLESKVNNVFPNLSNEKYNELLSYNNKVVKFTDPTNNNSVEYYKITLQEVLDTTNSTYTSGNYAYKSFEATGDLKVALNTIQKKSHYYKNVINSDHYFVRIKYQSIKIVANKLTYGTYKTTFPVATYHLTDAPYSMFCIPCPNPRDKVVIKNSGGSNASGITVDRNVSLRMAQELGSKYAGGGVIYDLQLLPYCPVTQIIKADGSLDLSNDPKLFCPITRTEGNSSVVSSYILFASFSQFTIDDIPLDNVIENKDIKINSQTDIYRIVSPNYNGQFEFNANKNGGLSGFNVDCTYKPYNPYIHINPHFGNLYGSDFDDARGLICGGDFSMTLVNNAWETYQIQNKNYQNIFDRDIQNMEVNNSVARQRDIYRGVTSTLGGGIAGAISGAKGGVVGMIAGGVVGTATAAAGSALNYQWNETLRNEAIDYKIDQFGYNLGNIQALPVSISKTTALTYNNKIFPILEYYTCKDEEKIALANKIAYNGMTVMRIGKIKDFINNEWSYTLKDTTVTSKNYIKGQLIKIEDINCDDFHVANEIANEIFKGAFYETKN